MPYAVFTANVKFSELLNPITTGYRIADISHSRQTSCFKATGRQIGKVVNQLQYSKDF